MPYDDQSIARDLRALLKARKRSARSVSQAISLPYRSLQNYLSGESRMPAHVLVDILDHLGASLHELRTGNCLLTHSDIYDAIWRVFGDALSEIDLDRLGERKPFSGGAPTPKEAEIHALRVRIASELAVRLSEAYDHFSREPSVAPHVRMTIKDIREKRLEAATKSGSGGTSDEVGQ